MQAGPEPESLQAHICECFVCWRAGVRGKALTSLADVVDAAAAAEMRGGQAGTHPGGGATLLRALASAMQAKLQVRLCTGYVLSTIPWRARVTRRTGQCRNTRDSVIGGRDGIGGCDVMQHEEAAPVSMRCLLMSAWLSHFSRAWPSPE